MANYTVDIGIAIKGSEKITRFNKQLETTSKQLKAVNELVRGQETSVGALVKSFDNLNKSLGQAKNNFNAVASGTRLQEKAARQLIRAEKDLNKEYQQREVLLQRLRGTGAMNLPGTGVGRDPVASSIQRRRRKLSRGANQYSSAIGPVSPFPDTGLVTGASSSLAPGQSLLGQSVKIEDSLRERMAIQDKLFQMEIGQTEAAKERTKQLNKQNNELRRMKVENQRSLYDNTYTQYSGPIGPGMASPINPEAIIGQRIEEQKRIQRRQDRLLRVRRGRDLQARMSNARSNAIIGGMFPLLFGQGLGAAAGGSIGGGIGGAKGGQFGFAFSLLGTVVGSSLDRMVGSLREFGEALDTTDNALKMMTNRNLFSSKAIQKQAESLKRQGKQAELTELITRDLSNSLGALSLDGVQKFSSEMEELTRQFGLLTTQFQLLAAGPLGRIIEMINSGLGRQVLESRISNQLRALEKADPQKFKQFLESNQRSRDETNRGRFENILNRLNNNPIAAFDTNIGPGNFQFAGRSDEVLQGISSALDPILKGLGITSGGLGKNDMDKAMALLETETGNLRAKNESLRSSFGIESAIAVLREKYVALDDEILDNLEIKAREQLKTNERLEIENHQLQMTLDLYKNIAISIENGIVTAIEGAIEGTKTLGDVARSVFSEIQRSLIRFGVNSLLSSIPGFGRFFRANGGPVSSGKSYIVGERGPELFTPNAGGRITSNENLNAGSTNIAINVDASGSSVEGDEQKGRELGQMLSAAIQSELIKQRRPGGLLT